MAKSGMKLTKRPPKPGAQYDFWRGELNKQLETVSRQRAKEYGQAVSHFSTRTRPDFKGEIVDRPNTVSIRVVLKNGSKAISKYGATVRDLWGWWNKGTGLYGPKHKAYPIFPRFASVLRFVIGGMIVFARYVNKPGKTHPGMRGTGAKDRIDKRLNPLERRAIDRAGRIAFQRLKRFIS